MRRRLPLRPSTPLDDGAEADAEDKERADAPPADTIATAAGVLPASGCCFCWCCGGGCVWLTSLLMRTPSSKVSTSTLWGGSEEQRGMYID